MSTKKSKKPKTFQDQEELENVCGDIITAVRPIFKDYKNKMVKEIIMDFCMDMSYIKDNYFNEGKIKKECRKDIFKFLMQFKNLLVVYYENPQDDIKISIGIKAETFLNLMKNCYIPTQSQKQQIKKLSELPYKNKVKKLMLDLMKIITSVISQKSQFEILNFQTDTQSRLNLRKFLLSETKKQFTADELTDIFSCLFANANNIISMFDNLQLGNIEMKRYIYNIVSIWKTNVKKDFNPNVRGIDRILLGYCGLTILKRVLLACLLVYEGHPELYMRYIDKLKPNIKELDDMMKIALNLKLQTKIYTPLMFKLRSRLQQKRLATPFISSFQPTEQQIRQWQQKFGAFLQDLDKQQKQQQKKLSSSLQTCHLSSSSKQTIPTTTKKQQLQQKTQTQQRLKQPFVFQYRSPHYRHRNDIRMTEQQNRLLGQRKQKNISHVQSSIITQSLPEIIMRIAMEGKYSSILLIDEANIPKQQLYSQQGNIHLSTNIIPWNIPKNARRKPLYILIQQGDLDQTFSPKATLNVDDRLLSSKGMIKINVSCVKQTKTGSLTDCYKKHHQQKQFTKNPMDDFVLLTLKYALRSYYYQYMKYVGVDVGRLKHFVETYENIISQNPYQVFLQQQDLGDIATIRHTYDKIKFDKLVPYTWVISRDHWRDWARLKH